MHGSCQPDPCQSLLRYASRPPLTTALRDTSIYSVADPTAQFKHKRLIAGKDGKISIFRTHNIIRGGKYTYAHAVNAILRYVKYTNSEWPTVMFAVNMVLSGKLSNAVPRRIHQHASSSNTKKFPGIAIRIPGMVCTPSVFRRSRNINIPGSSGVDDLIDTLTKVFTRFDKVRD
jgi:hypothetical protein